MENEGLKYAKLFVYNNMALNVFLSTLPEDMVQLVLCKAPVTLEAALSVVLEEMNFLEQNNMRNRIHDRTQTTGSIPLATQQSELKAFSHDIGTPPKLNCCMPQYKQIIMPQIKIQEQGQPQIVGTSYPPGFEDMAQFCLQRRQPTSLQQFGYKSNELTMNDYDGDLYYDESFYSDHYGYDDNRLNNYCDEGYDYYMDTDYDDRYVDFKQTDVPSSPSSLEREQVEVKCDSILNIDINCSVQVSSEQQDDCTEQNQNSLDRPKQLTEHNALAVIQPNQLTSKQPTAVTRSECLQSEMKTDTILPYSLSSIRLDDISDQKQDNNFLYGKQSPLTHSEQHIHSENKDHLYEIDDKKENHTEHMNETTQLTQQKPTCNDSTNIVTPEYGSSLVADPKIILKAFSRQSLDSDYCPVPFFAQYTKPKMKLTHFEPEVEWLIGQNIFAENRDKQR